MAQQIMLSIIIPTKDREYILRKTLNALFAGLEQCAFGWEVVVVSNSDKLENLQDYEGRLILLHNTFKKSSASTRNMGGAQAKGAILMFLDDDILIQGPQILEQALIFHQQHHKACFNPDWQYPPALLHKMDGTPFGRYLQHTGFTERRRLSAFPWQSTPFEAPEIASFCFCLKKEHFEAIGGYDEQFQLTGTDEEISQKLKQHGISIYTLPQFMVYHNEEDRITLKGWLSRQYTVGVYKGEKDRLEGNKPPYGKGKKAIFLFIHQIGNNIASLLTLWPNIKALDGLYMKIANSLQGAYLCAGYFDIKKPQI